MSKDMDLPTIVKALNDMGSISMSAVLIVIVFASGYLLWKLFQQTVLDNGTGARIATSIEQNNAEMRLHREFMENVAKRFDGETAWLRSFMKDKMEQDVALSRLEQNTKRLLERLEDVQESIHKVIASKG